MKSNTVVKDAEGKKLIMMASEVVLVFPHQLFKSHPYILNDRHVVLVEEFLFFRQYKFHKQKLKFHRATMKYYQDYLEGKGIKTTYINSYDSESDIRDLIPKLAGDGIKNIYICDPVDNWLISRLKTTCIKNGLNLIVCDTPMFLNTEDGLKSYFGNKKKYFQTSFYIDQRKSRNILIDTDGSPVGGKWTFDAENRKKFPKTKKAPFIKPKQANKYDLEANEYIREHFNENYGNSEYSYPTIYEEAENWLSTFLTKRLAQFGEFEDAIVSDETILFHSLLTPMLNIGLLLPDQIINAALEHSKYHEIPINSLEGFVRQILGWREFIRGVYILKGKEVRKRNFWNFNHSVPDAFYTGTTDILPLDIVISRLLKTGYNHHIERLMVLGNFLFLSRTHPDAVYQWFMEMYIDAYDWVMVPNVYGMSQYADGGLMSTKPYFSGSNYLMKMSDFKAGEWQQIWDALFWFFISDNREFCLKNPRLSMLVRNWDKWEETKKENLLSIAEKYLSKLNQNEEAVESY